MPSPLPPNAALRGLILAALSQGCAAQSTPTPAPTPAMAEPVAGDAPGPPEPGPGSAAPAEPERPEPHSERPDQPSDHATEVASGPQFRACPGEVWSPGTGVTPARAVDGVVQRTWADRDGRKMGEQVATAPCTTAPDADACRAALDALPRGSVREDTTQMGLFRSDLVWSASGEVGVVDSRTALVTWLGPVDSAGDARLIAWADGYTPACDREPAATERGWSVVAVRRVNDCPVTTNSYEITVAGDGALTVDAEHPGQPTGVCIGRLAPGMDEPEACEAELGAWLGSVARLEGAAVLAFEQLAAELCHHEAPAALVEAALAAAEDEVRHSVIFTELALAHGVEPPAVPPCDHRVRSLFEIALDNAREGLVRERYGAVVGLWQARHAATAQLRAAFGEVALDEVRHAELSVALDAWLRTRLSESERAAVDEARAEAAAALRPRRSSALGAVVGLPSPEAAAALYDRAVGAARV